MRLIALMSALMLATPACAQNFNVSLGAKVLGQMAYAEQGRKATLRSTLNSTPMGVFNGTFVGTSTGIKTTGSFTGESRSSRKQRSVTVDIAKGRAVGISITPQDELTDLSDISRVPAGVMDPVRTIGALVRAGGCPKGMRMYDGRRVVTLTPGDSGKDGNLLTCSMEYRVTAGPGHLSPLGISSAKLVMLYNTSGGQQALQQIQISSGIFRVSLDRIQ